MMHIQTSRPGLKVVQVSSGATPSRKPAPPELEIQDTNQAPPIDEPGDSNEQTQQQMKAIHNPIKQRAAAQVAITAGLGTAAYFLRGTNQIAFWLFLIGAVIAGYTVVQPHQRKNGSIRPSAIAALSAPDTVQSSKPARQAKAA